MNHFPILHLKLSKSYERLSEAIAAESSVSRPEAEGLIYLGAVYVDRKRSPEDRHVNPGAYVRVHTRPRRFPVPVDGFRGLIYHEAEDFLIANKPQGLPSHPTLDNSRENLLALLSAHAPVRPTHRLDQFTAGLIVFAKNADFQRRFSRWLEQRSVKKEYVTYTEGPLPIGPMIDYMSPEPVTPRRLATTPQPAWRRCELVVLESSTRRDAVQSRLQLITGRTHQIRAQLSSRGQPIIGDAAYGSTRPWPGQPTLIAAKIAFPRSKQEFWTFSLEI